MELSVVVPNYNNEKFLPQCIESILSQTYKPAEILIVDDCSTDNSPEIIKNYQRKYKFIRGIILNKNRGVSNARNAGITEARGEYITTIDSDDFYYNKCKLKNEMELIKYYKELHNQDVIIYSRTVNVDISGDYLGKNDPDYFQNEYYYLEGNILFRLLSGFKFGFIPRDYCFKKSIYFECGGYNLNMNFYEDLDLLIRLAGKYSFYCTKEAGTAYRQHSMGLSARSSEEHYRYKYNIYKKNNTLLRKYKRVPAILLFKLINLRFNLKKLLHNSKKLRSKIFLT